MILLKKQNFKFDNFFAAFIVLVVFLAKFQLYQKNQFSSIDIKYDYNKKENYNKNREEEICFEKIDWNHIKAFSFNPNPKLSAAIIPSGNSYNTYESITKILNKVDWSQYKKIIYLSVSRSSEGICSIPEKYNNTYLNMDHKKTFFLSKKKSNIKFITFQLNQKGFSNTKKSKILSKENDWQNVLFYFTNLKNNIEFIPLVIGSYNESSIKKITEYIKKNPDTFIIANINTLYCGLLFNDKCSINKSSREFDSYTMTNIRNGINSPSTQKSKKLLDIEQIKGYKNILYFIKICKNLEYKSDKILYFENKKEIGNKKFQGYISMLVIKK